MPYSIIEFASNKAYETDVVKYCKRQQSNNQFFQLNGLCFWLDCGGTSPMLR